MSKTIFVLTILFVVQFQKSLSLPYINNHAAIPEAALEYAQKRVNDTLQFLVKFREEIPAAGNKLLDVYLDRTKNAISKTVERIPKEIEKQIEDTNSTGPNAQTCKTTAQVELKNAEKKVLPLLDNCLKDNPPNWSPLQDIATVFLAQGEKLYKDVTEYEKKCLTDSGCTKLELDDIRRTALSYDITISQLRIEATTAIRKNKKAIRECSEELMKFFEATGTAAQEKALSCIKSA